MPSSVLEGRVETEPYCGGGQAQSSRHHTQPLAAGGHMTVTKLSPGLDPNSRCKQTQSL